MPITPPNAEALKPNVFCAACGSREILALLAEKWSILLLHALMDGPMRTADLRRRVDGISEKMLIQTLRSLERHGMVARHAYPEVPPRVEYRLTPLGTSLSTLVSALDTWVETNFAEILAARIAFDGPEAGKKG